MANTYISLVLRQTYVVKTVDDECKSRQTLENTAESLHHLNRLTFKHPIHQSLQPEKIYIVWQNYPGMKIQLLYLITTFHY